jgi:hypothetical protein
MLKGLVSIRSKVGMPIFRQFLVQQMKINSKTTWVSENKEYAII